MSWHLPHRFTNIHHAVSIALFCSVSSAVLLPVAHAATMGKTTITSSQHEPLAATIMVSDIDPKDFSASLANPSVYQQMGLTPTATMSVRFVPTSATTGQLLISTSQPVSLPFADIVLSINDNGQRNMMPKTLLMPLGNNVPVKQPNRVVSGAKKPNLPVVSDLNSTPLAVRRGAPPPLLMAPNIQAPIQTQTLVETNVSQVVRKTDTSDRSLNSSALNSSSVAGSANSNANNSSAGTITTVDSISADKGLNSSAPSINATAKNKNAQNHSVLATEPVGATSNTDKQKDILNIQVTRQIQLKKDLSDNKSDQPIPFANKNDNTNTPLNAPLPSATTGQNSNNITAAPVSDSTSSAMTSYTVQRNDNLWIISQQIAQQNNLDVPTVMKQIKAQNPDAFIKQDADLLKANATLSLPSYDVVPSQQSLQTAIAAQREHYLKNSKSATKQTSKNKPRKPEFSGNAKAIASKKAQIEEKTATNPSDKPSNIATKTLPKARFSVVAPGRDGSADGTQTKAAAATGNGLSTDILATLKSARQRNAEQAKRVSATNSTLGSYAKKLQLQNQKLAELEARLKKLRNQ